jgi:hypothetical protein
VNSDERTIMQSKVIKSLRDGERICSACGHEGSPNAGPSDDLRWYDDLGPWHPICKEEVDRLFEQFNENGTPRETAIEIFEQLGINLHVLGINGKPASDLVK